MSFSKEIVEAICTYMNQDPTGFNLTIVQGHTNERTASSAELIHFDGNGAQFKAYFKEESKEVNVPWQRTISERFEVREQLFFLFETATDELLKDE